MMTYKKDPGVTFTQMAIWIDENVYSGEVDPEILYRYLYHLAYMLAKKRNFFSNLKDYDQFALFVATRMYFRLTNPKQFPNGDGTPPKLPKVKSVLNYLKKVLSVCKVDFQRQEALLQINDTDFTIHDTDLGEYLVDNTNIFDKILFSRSLEEIDVVVRTYLSSIPIKKDSAEWENIYISCMLSLINCMTLSRKDRHHMNTFVTLDATALERMYTKLRYEEPILYHLDENMRGYIRVLVNELKHCIARDLSWKSETYISSDALIKGVLSCQEWREQE